MDGRELPVVVPPRAQSPHKLHAQPSDCPRPERERRGRCRRFLGLRVGLVDLDGRIATSGRLHDLSVDGCRIDGLPLGEARFEWGDFTPLMPDTIVSLSIETLPTLIRGRIAWRKNGTLGIRFTKVPLHGLPSLQRLAEGWAPRAAVGDHLAALLHVPA